MAIVYGTQVPRLQKREIIAEKPKRYGLNFPIGTKIAGTTFNRGYFAKEFRNCGNGYYYLLINDNYFIGYDVD